MEKGNGSWGVQRGAMRGAPRGRHVTRAGRTHEKMCYFVSARVMVFDFFGFYDFSWLFLGSLDFVYFLFCSHEAHNEKKVE